MFYHYLENIQQITLRHISIHHHKSMPGWGWHYFCQVSKKSEKDHTKKLWRIIR
jgi:hypothetical protein